MIKPLVAIGMPSGDMVHTDFALALAILCLQTEVEISLLNARSSLVPVGRNQCASAAHMMQASHLFFLDTDMTFPADALTRLLAHDKDIVGATYSGRREPLHPLTITEAGEHRHVTQGLQAVLQLPAGCLLIKTGVFDRLKKPFFALTPHGEQLLGEDYHFCAQARAAGFTLWCDGDLSSQVGHIGQKIYRIPEPVPGV